MATNEYGLDVSYFRNKLEILLRDIDRYTPKELHTELKRMAITAKPKNICSSCGAAAMVMLDADNNYCTGCKRCDIIKYTTIYAEQVTPDVINELVEKVKNETT